ncbi:hypothetical protein pdam_00002282 [Pocillopora damicornis]|uniref:Uncharacterized protein n=1 Tax=Pocillopora damicornis TaxID=46731 RepID=A0A3M6TFK6_POCDA|nr:hypothetical protein pdam_00002282 [Pocillopora damicornis]
MAVKGADLCDRTFEREIECKDGILKIKQAEVGDESCVVWDAALVLAKYLQTEHFCPTKHLSLEPLVSTLCDLSNENTTILISYEERTTGNKPQLEKKFHQLIKEHFIVEEIPEEQQDSVYHSPDIHLLKLKRKL